MEEHKLGNLNRYVAFVAGKKRGQEIKYFSLGGTFLNEELRNY
jgi:hypothetical protein